MKLDFKKQWPMFLVLAIGIVIILFKDEIKRFFSGITKSEEEKQKENLYPEKDPGKTYQQRAVIWDRHVAWGKDDVCNPIVLILTQTHNEVTKAIKYFKPQSNVWESCDYTLKGKWLTWLHMTNYIHSEDQWVVEQCPELFVGVDPEERGNDMVYHRDMNTVDLPETSEFVKLLVNRIFRGKYIEMEFVGIATEV